MTKLNIEESYGRDESGNLSDSLQNSEDIIESFFGLKTYLFEPEASTKKVHSNISPAVYRHILKKSQRNVFYETLIGVNVE